MVWRNLQIFMYLFFPPGCTSYEHKKIRRDSRHYTIFDGVLYRQGIDGVLRRAIDAEEASKVVLSLPWRRPTCRGDLAIAAWRAHLLATSLWELVNDATAMVSRTSSSDPPSCYYAIVGGRGRGWEEKKRERGEWGIDPKRSNNGKQ